MPRRETEQLELFETVLFLSRAILVYIRNADELARMISPGDRDIAIGIIQNLRVVRRKLEEAIGAHSELAAELDYKHLRDDITQK